MAKQNQVWATVSEEHYKFIENLSISEKRSISQVTAMLVESAIKERTRPRNGKKKEKANE